MNVIQTSVTLFLLMAVGYTLKKKNMVGDRFQADLSSYVMNMALPLFILAGTMMDIPQDRHQMLLQMAIICFIFYIVAVIFSRLIGILFSKDKEGRPPYAFSAVFSNVGFMGYPVIIMVLGEEGILYAAVFNIFFNLFIWSYGISVFSGGFRLEPRRIINPQILASIGGISLALLGIELPQVLQPFITAVGSTATPMAMIILGMMISGIQWKAFFEDIRYVLISLFRLVVVPVLSYLVLTLLGVPDILVATLTILVGMPVATNAVVICLYYGHEVDTMAKIVVVSTILSLLTIPFYALFFS